VRGSRQANLRYEPATLLFLCEGTHGAGLLERQGCPQEKIGVSRLAVRSASIQPVAKEKRPGELRLIQIATMSEKTGHRYTLEAFLAALEDCPGMHLTFVGADMPNNQVSIGSWLKARTREAGAEDKVTLIPRIPFDRLHSYLSAFHVFIHPSVYAENRDSEGGAPIVLLDAQATGMPVIATTHCDIPDEVIYERTGLLAVERYVSETAAHIRRFYEMRQEEYRFATRGEKTCGDSLRHQAKCGDHPVAPVLGRP